jgi:hypothetical protein
MYTHYRGTTFQFAGVLQNNGVAQDLTNGTLVAKVFDKTATNLYGTLTVTVLDPVNGLVTLSYPNTGSWPVGNARMDCTLTLPNGTLLASDPEFFRIAQNPVVA